MSRNKPLTFSRKKLSLEIEKGRGERTFHEYGAKIGIGGSTLNRLVRQEYDPSIRILFSLMNTLHLTLEDVTE